MLIIEAVHCNPPSKMNDNVTTEVDDDANLFFKMNDSDTDEGDDDDKKIPAVVVETPTKGNKAIDEATIIRCSPRLNNGRTEKEFHDDVVVSKEGKVLLRPNIMFETAEALNSHIQSYAKQNGFLVSKAHTYYDCDSDVKKDSISQRFPLGSFCVKKGKDGRDKGPLQRGRFMCNAAKAQCTWQLNFTHTKLPVKHSDFSYKYMIKPEGFNLTHTPHRMLGITINECVGTYDLVYSERQLGAEADKFYVIKHCLPATMLA